MRNISILLTLFVICQQFSAQNKLWSLNDCVAYAKANGITIQQSELDIEASEVNKKGAIGNFLPSINASASNSWGIGLRQDPITFSAVNSTTSNLTGNINANVDLYNGLRNLNQLHRSKLDILAKQYQLESIKNDIGLTVANSFLQILFNKEQLKVLELQQEQSKEELGRIQNMVDAGVLPKGDLLEIEATITSQSQQIVNAKNAVLISKINLAQILLVEDYQNFDIEDTEYNIPPTGILNESPGDIVSKAKTTQYDVKIAETNAELAKYDLKMAKGALQPTLSGFYSFGTNYFTSQLFQNVPFETQISDNKQHNFGLQLSIPIFNGFSAKNNVKQSKINLERSKNLLAQANLDLEVKVYRAYTDTQNAQKTYEATIKTLEARKQAFNFSQERYNVGLLNAFDLNQSRLQLENAQSEMIRSKYDYIFKIKVLEFYFGIPIANLK